MNKIFKTIYYKFYYMDKIWNSAFIYSNNNPNKHKTVWVMEKEIEDGIIVILGCDLHEV